MSLRTAHILWAVWFFGWFSTFLVFEIWALCTDWRRTLSAAIWSLESEQPGQPFWQWSFGHLAFMGVFTLMVFWLFFHFGWGLFR